jgi:cobalt transporter subunit CbtA
MIQRMLTSALFAGCVAGLFAALLHFAFVQEYILLGEKYESGAITHFSSGSSIDDMVAIPPSAAHDPAASSDSTNHGSAAAHDYGLPPSDFVRNGLTVLFTVLIYASYAMLLLAGFGLAEAAGYKVAAAEGMLWGLAGFAAFQLAPAMGFAPELPGTIAAELSARQLWWWGTVAATASALALIGYGRKPWALLLAVGLLAAPHVIGAPDIDAFYGSAPPEVAAMFAARVLGVGLVVWACLGWTAGYFWQRSAASV